MTCSSPTKSASYFVYLYYMRNILAVKPQRLKANGFPCVLFKLMTGFNVRHGTVTKFYIISIENFLEFFVLRKVFFI